MENLLTIIKKGGVILYPTDTIWGIGCDATDEAATDKVYALKKRPVEKGMIVLMSSEEMLESYGVVLTAVQKEFLQKAEKPVTMVLDGVTGIAANAYYPDRSLAVRIVRAEGNNPGAMRCHNFIEAFGKPIISTSANLSGEPSPASFALVSETVKTEVDGAVNPAIADSKGNPSQIVRIDPTGEVVILRP